MKALWTQSKAEYHGELVNFPPAYQCRSRCRSRTRRSWWAGRGRTRCGRVIAYGDGWMPNRVANIAERVAELQRMAADAGRGSIPVTVYGVRPTPEGVEQMIAAGVERAIFPLPPAPAETVLPLLDRQAALIEQFRDA